MRLPLVLAATVVAVLLGCASESASTTASSPAVSGDLAPPSATTVSGTIESYTRTPAGDPDGFVLASGQRVHVPPALGAQVTDRFPTNTSVVVNGVTRTDPDGRQVIEADRLTNPASNATLDIASLRGAPSVPAPGIGGSGTTTDPQRPMSTPVPPPDTPTQKN
jgi:hypothetical protein